MLPGASAGSVETPQLSAVQPRCVTSRRPQPGDRRTHPV